MKLTLTTLILFSFCSSIFGQLPNGGFEDWENLSHHDKPLSWNTNQDTLYTRIIKSTDRVQGDFALQFVSSEVPSAWQDCSGVINIRTNNPYPQSTEQRISFFIKSHANNSQNITYTNIKVSLFENGIFIDNVAWENQSIINEYTQFNINLPAVVYDSLFVVIVSGALNGAADGCWAQSNTWIDGMTLEIASDVIEVNDISNAIYPNPVQEVLHFRDVSFDQYRIIDILGNEIKSGDYSPSLNLQELKSGLYFLELFKNNVSHINFTFSKL